MMCQSHQLGAQWVNQAIPDFDCRNPLREPKGKAGGEAAVTHSREVLAMEVCA